MNLLSKSGMVACLVGALAGLNTTIADAKSLKVYILAGQSNMQGQAMVSSFAGMAMDPEAKPLYDKLVDSNGKPRVLDKVDIVAFSGSRFENGGYKEDSVKQGKLTVGYGGDTTIPDRFGPELGFGVTMSEGVKEPILLIKTSWGGKSLMVDFRPPSGGPYYKHPEELIDRTNGKGATTTKEQQLEAVGHFYRLMIQHIRTVLDDPGKYCPAYNPKDGYEIAGFAWFQGYNDLVGKYPGDKKNKDYSEYSRLLACFIRDVRKDLSAPNMPFAIGVIGIDGKNASGNMVNFRKAMAAPAAMDEFKGNVKAVNTADFWDEKLGELESRKGVASEKKGNQNGAEDKYAALREKIAPLQKELAAIEAQTGKGRSKAKMAELRKKIEDALFTPEELDYVAKNRASQGYHYNGSAKTYSQIGEALANAVLSMSK